MELKDVAPGNVSADLNSKERPEFGYSNNVIAVIHSVANAALIQVCKNYLVLAV